MNDEELARDVARRLLDGGGGPAVWADLDDAGAAAVRATLAALIREEQGLEWADAERQASELLLEELGRRDAFRQAQEIGPDNMVDPLSAPPRPGQIQKTMQGDPDPRHLRAWRARIAEATTLWRRRGKRGR